MILYLNTIAVSLKIVAEGDVDDSVCCSAYSSKYNEAMNLSHFSKIAETIKVNH
jgi:hypothetical protein